MEDLYINFPTHIQQDTKYLSKKSWARQTYSTCDTDLATLCLKLEYLVTLCLKLECWLTRYLTREIKRVLVLCVTCASGLQKTIGHNEWNLCFRENSVRKQRQYLHETSILC